MNYHGTWTPCLIQDISNSGFCVLSRNLLTVGQVVELKCEPFPGSEFQCQVEIRHVSDSCVGVLITEMNEGGRRLCAQLMQNYHSDRKSLNQ